MNRLTALAAAALFAMSVNASAQTAPADKKDGGSLSSEEMETEKGTGTATTPTAKPQDNSLSGGAKKDMPSTEGAGVTDDPTAKAQDGSLSTGAKGDTEKK